MMRTLGIAIFFALTLPACSDPYHNLYEGIKSQNEARRTPQERAMNPAPSYDTYKKEREQGNATTAP
jgi:hypothetical protein